MIFKGRKLVILLLLVSIVLSLTGTIPVTRFFLLAFRRRPKNTGNRVNKGLSGCPGCDTTVS